MFKINKMNFALFIILLVNICMIIFHVLYTYNLNSDDAVKIILAQEILATKDLLPNDWYYVNGDVWVIFLHLLLVPLIKLFGFNYTTYTINAFAYISVYFASAIYFLNTIKISFTSKVLFLIMLCIPGANSFGDPGYYMMMYILELLTLGILIRFYDSIYSLKKTSVLLSTLIFIFYLHNPKRHFIYHLLPILSTIAYIWYIKGLNKFDDIKLGIVIILAFVFSIIFYITISTNLHIVHGASNIMFASYDSFIKNLNIFWNGLLFTYGVISNTEVPITSIDGFKRILFIGFFSLLIFSIMKRFKVTDKNIDETAVNIYFIASGILITFFYLFTVPLAYDVSSFRYFHPLVILSYIYVLFFLEQIKFISLKKSLILIIGCFTLSVNYYTYVYPYQQGYKNIHVELIQSLKENNLSHGFASYWHSHVTTVLSEGIKVYPINMAETYSAYSTVRWMSSERWYRDFNADRSFVIFANDEFSKYSNALFSKINPEKVITLPNFKIAIFDKNIFDINVLPAYFEGAELLSNTGNVKQKDRIVIEGIDRSGYMTFGPYITLAKGNYKFDISYISSESNKTAVGNWDVCITLPNGIHLQLKSGELFGTENKNRHIEQTFSISDEYSNGKIEIRNFYNGVGNLTIKSLTINQ